jgi:hypothetical protein
MCMYIYTMFYHTTMLLASYFTLNNNSICCEHGALYSLQINRSQHLQAVIITTVLISPVCNTTATSLFLASFYVFKKTYQPYDITKLPVCPFFQLLKH